MKVTEDRKMKFTNDNVFFFKDDKWSVISLAENWF